MRQTTTNEMIGQQYGMLKVREIIIDGKHSRNRTKYYAVSICDCGKQHKCLASSIKAGRTTSCGCRRDQYQKTTGKNSVQFTGYEDISGKFYTNMRRKAEIRNLDFDVSIEYLWNLFIKQGRRCKLSNIDLLFSNKSLTHTASLDRIDSTLGYIEGNVQWVHKRINIMKNTFNQKEFIYYCIEIGKHNT